MGVALKARDKVGLHFGAKKGLENNENVCHVTSLLVRERSSRDLCKSPPG
jgi:hypothetical protein